jgi:hypothetical protein
MGETVYAGDLTGKHELVLIFLHGVGQQGAEVVQDFTTHCGALPPALPIRVTAAHAPRHALLVCRTPRRDHMQSGLGVGGVRLTGR